MPRTTACGVLWAVFAAAAVGQPVAVIVGPTEAVPGDLVILRTTGTVGSGHTWLILPESAESKFLPILDSSGNQAAVFASSQPGVYVFILGVAEGDRVSLTKHVLTQGSAPPPPVPPDPDPPGPDPPIDKATAAVIVYDENLILPEQMERIVQVRREAEGTDLRIFAFDKNDKDEANDLVAPPYVALVDQELPILVVYDQRQVIWKGQLPGTIKELRAVLGLRDAN